MNSERQEPDDYRALLYQRQAIIATEFLSDKALTACHRWLIQGTSDVLIKQKGEKVGYGHLQTCKKRWLCPLCADRAARKMRARLVRAIQAEQIAGYRPLFITYTAQHTLSLPLSVSSARIRAAHRRLHSGKRFEGIARDCGWDGSFRSYEITYGQSGWHFHIHELSFTRCGASTVLLADFLSGGWRSAIEKEGGYAQDGVGLVLEDAKASVAGYISKFGLAAELTQGIQKQKAEGGLLPFQLADVPISEPRRAEWARRLFQEYAAATRGLQQSCPGGSLRALFRHIKDSPTDTDYQTDILASITVNEWRSVVRRGRRADLLRAAECRDKLNFDAIIGRAT